MASYNHVELIGNVGRLEVKTFSNGGKVVEVSLATTRRYKDRSGELKEDTQWHRLVLRGTASDFAEQYVRKGDLVQAVGELTYRKYTNREGVETTLAEVQALQLNLLRSQAGKEAEPAPKPAPAPERDEALERSGLLDNVDADLPF